jgi:hypothetical protein
MKPYTFSPLIAIFSLVFAVVAMLGCGDDADRLPCISCGEGYRSQCGDYWYDPSTEFCYGTWSVYRKCGGSDYYGLTDTSNIKNAYFYNRTLGFNIGINL